ncbi:MAG: glycosyl transferase family 1 [Bacteroidetes bacterium B1(2017)]|nr:MAG: glycosyl transferase family 1 [Bacteroidetes bacterium B1(2017)]
MKNKKKILIVGPAFPLRGGLATYDERLCREFLSQGHSCEILSFSLQYPSLLFPGKTQFSSDPTPTDIVIHSEVNSINPLNWIIVGNKFAKKKYDMVIFRYWMSFMAPSFGTIARALRKSGAKVLAITDNIVPHEKRFFDSAFTNYFLNSCDGFLSMSKEVQAQAQALQPNKKVAYVAHPMYDMFGQALDKKVAIEKLGLDAQYNYILFFGFIRKYKGLSLLLDSFAKLDRQKLKLKLILAGEFYEPAEPYLQQIQDLGLLEDVVLKTDFIPNAEVSLYFSASDMVVQTYLSATQSGVTQIAYYYNKPMLVTNVGGLAELVPHKKVGYVCSQDATEIAESITHFYEHKMETTFELGVEEEKQKFTWAYLTEQLFSL